MACTTAGRTLRVDSCATMWFMVIFMSLFTARERYPSATALVTFKMERTLSVRMLAIF